MAISPKQFESMKQRVAGATRRPTPVTPSPVPAAHALAAGPHVILGIDPSLRSTGYGIIRAQRSQFQWVAHGQIRSPAGWNRSRCLAHIAGQLRCVLQEHLPTVCVIEGLFYAQNFQTALIMGEARGAALATVAEAGLEIYEIAPRRMKQAIVGFGAAQKVAVGRMVQRLLQLPAPPEADAGDALALALAFGQELRQLGLKKPTRV